MSQTVSGYGVLQSECKRTLPDDAAESRRPIFTGRYDVLFHDMQTYENFYFPTSFSGGEIRNSRERARVTAVYIQRYSSMPSDSGGI